MFCYHIFVVLIVVIFMTQSQTQNMVFCDNSLKAFGSYKQAE